MDATQLGSLAAEIESADNVDWGMISLDPNEVYIKMAHEVIKLYNSHPEDESMHMLLALATKLLVENYVLSIQLYGFKYHS